MHLGTVLLQRRHHVSFKHHVVGYAGNGGIYARHGVARQPSNVVEVCAPALGCGVVVICLRLPSRRVTRRHHLDIPTEPNQVRVHHHVVPNPRNRAPGAQFKQLLEVPTACSPAVEVRLHIRHLEWKPLLVVPADAILAEVSLELAQQRVHRPGVIAHHPNLPDVRHAAHKAAHAPLQRAEILAMDHIQDIEKALRRPRGRGAVIQDVWVNGRPRYYSSPHHRGGGRRPEESGPGDHGGHLWTPCLCHITTDL